MFLVKSCSHHLKFEPIQMHYPGFFFGGGRGLKWREQFNRIFVLRSPLYCQKKTLYISPNYSTVKKKRLFLNRKSVPFFLLFPYTNQINQFRKEGY